MSLRNTCGPGCRVFRRSFIANDPRYCRDRTLLHSIPVAKAHLCDAGEGLTRYVREGCPVHAAVHGPGLALKATANRLSLAISAFASPPVQNIEPVFIPEKTAGSSIDSGRADGSSSPCVDLSRGLARNWNDVWLGQATIALTRSLSAAIFGQHVGKTHRRQRSLRLGPSQGVHQHMRLSPYISHQSCHTEYHLFSLHSDTCLWIKAS